MSILRLLAVAIAWVYRFACASLMTISVGEIRKSGLKNESNLWGDESVLTWRRNNRWLPFDDINLRT